MEFRILGSLEVWDGDRELALSGGKQRALLALPLFHANRSVSEDVLIDGLWGETASPKAAENLHVLVSRLRRALGSDRIVRAGGGYLIRVEEDELDVDRFQRLRSKGRQREALDLWRGPPFADFMYEPWAEHEARRLDELRLLTLEERIEANLASGRHAELVGELQALVGEHPLRETLRRHLIVALYRSGRQAEALEAYQEARRMLDEELGLEPSPALRELEGAVLRQDPSLSAPPVHRDAQPVRRARRRAAAVAVAGIALVLGFGAAIAAIRLIDDGGEQRTLAAAIRSDRATTRPSTASAQPQPPTTRVVIVRERVRPQPQPPPAAPKAPTTTTTTATTKASIPPTPPQPAPKKQRPRPRVRPRSKPPPPPAPPAPQPAVAPLRIADNFDDNVLDRTIWYGSSSTRVSIEERDRRLEVSVQPDAVGEGDYKLISASYGTTCRYLGDFDARVDFELLDWPEANGVVVQLAAWFNEMNVGAMRQSQTWSEEYASWMTNRGRSSPSADRRGALRMRRVGDRITTYFRRAEGWYPLQSARGFNGAPIIGIQAMSKDEWFADKPVRIAFDNFTLTAARPAC